MRRKVFANLVNKLTHYLLNMFSQFVSNQYSLKLINFMIDTMTTTTTIYTPSLLVPRLHPVVIST